MRHARPSDVEEPRGRHARIDSDISPGVSPDAVGVSPDAAPDAVSGEGRASVDDAGDANRGAFSTPDLSDGRDAPETPDVPEPPEPSTVSETPDGSETPETPDALAALDAPVAPDLPGPADDGLANEAKRPLRGDSFSIEDDSAIGFLDLTEAERAAVDELQASLRARAKAAAGKHVSVAGQEGDGTAPWAAGDARADDDAAEGAEAPTGDEPGPASPSARPGALRRLALRLDEKSGGRVYAHKWQIAATLAVVGIVLIGLPLGFAAGWGIASGGASPVDAPDAAAEAGLTDDQERRNANVAARYEALGFDISAMDRVAAEDMRPITVDPVAVQPTTELQRLSDVDVSAGTGIKIDVPIVNQLDDSNGGRRLMAGCEIASLAMMLRYSGVEVVKEELQDAMPTVPLTDGSGLYGNPNRAFVGNMAGDHHGAGYSVYHGPVAELAQHYLLNRSFKVVDLTGQSFTVLLKELASGNPCWVITTTSMQPDMLADSWETADGPVVVNWALHSVVVTGYDDGHIFINDPYGYEQNVAYDRDGFEQAWKLMGSQAVTIVPTN